MFPLDSLGWDAAFAAAFDQLQDDNLLPARVAAQHRGEYVLFAEEGELRARAAGRMFHDHEVGGQLPAVGDWVGVTPPATITAILERRSAFIRKTAGKDSTEQVLAANVDTAFLLAGLDDDFSLRRLERYITSAWESGAAADRRPDESRSLPGRGGRRAGGGDPSRSACPCIPSRTCRATGSMRSSTTFNPVEPSCCSARPVSASRRCSTGWREKRSCARVPLRPTEPDVTRRLTVSSSSCPAAGSSSTRPACASSSSGRATSVRPSRTSKPSGTTCRFRDCAHASEPGCAVLEAVDNGSLELDRLRSWRKLQRELETIAARTDHRLRIARKKRWKEMASVTRQKSRR